MPTVELVYFSGCPHVHAARAALRDALAMTGQPPVWQEWDQTRPTAPARVQGFGSPTILVGGRDVSGNGRESAGLACRSHAIPEPEVIAAALRVGT
jgi:hypothetical protein